MERLKFDTFVSLLLVKTSSVTRRDTTVHWYQCANSDNGGDMIRPVRVRKQFSLRAARLQCIEVKSAMKWIALNGPSPSLVPH